MTLLLCGSCKYYYLLLEAGSCTALEDYRTFLKVKRHESQNALRWRAAIWRLVQSIWSTRQTPIRLPVTDIFLSTKLRANANIMDAGNLHAYLYHLANFILISRKFIPNIPDQNSQTNCLSFLNFPQAVIIEQNDCKKFVSDKCSDSHWLPRGITRPTTTCGQRHQCRSQGPVAEASRGYSTKKTNHQRMVHFSGLITVLCDAFGRGRSAFQSVLHRQALRLSSALPICPN